MQLITTYRWGTSVREKISPQLQYLLRARAEHPRKWNCIWRDVPAADEKIIQKPLTRLASLPLSGSDLEELLKFHRVGIAQSHRESGFWHLQVSVDLEIALSTAIVDLWSGQFSCVVPLVIGTLQS